MPTLTPPLRDAWFHERSAGELLAFAARYAQQYLDAAATREVFPQPPALAALDRFDEPLPAEPAGSIDVLRTLNEVGSPATVCQAGGRYFGYVNGAAAPVAVAAGWLAAVWDQNAATAASSPLVSKLEEVVEGWLVELFEMPAGAVAGFVSGSSVATLCGLAAARHRLLANAGWDVNRRGLAGAPPLRIVMGNEAHASVDRALRLLGYGSDSVERVETDIQGRVRLDRLPQLDRRTVLVLQAGNVNSGAFDPIAEAVLRAREAGAWTHIDGAFGLWAAASQRLRHLVEGVGGADSLAADAHKTLNTPYDSGVVLCRDREALADALRMDGAYLPADGARNGMAYTPEMSRRARVVELWATVKRLGRAGMDDLVTGLHDRAVQFAEALRSAGFDVPNDVVFNQVLVTCGDDRLTMATLHAVQRSGECWCGPSRWHGRAVIRISVSSWATTAEDVARSVDCFIRSRDAARRSE